MSECVVDIEATNRQSLLVFGEPELGYLYAGLFMAAGCVLASIPVLYDLIWSPTWPTVPLNVSYVLVAVVGLLGLEWLTRKLLKLA